MNNRLIYKPYALYAGTIFELQPGQTGAEVAALYGWAAGTWQEFAYTDFDPACYNFPGAFTLVANVVGFDLPTAKTIANAQVQQQAGTEQQTALAGYTAEVLAAQATLPEVNRTPAIQTAIETVNSLNDTLQAQLATITASTTIDQVNGVVNPPDPVPTISGQLHITRTGLDLTNAFFHTVTGVSDTAIQLRLVPTSQTLYYIEPDGYTPTANAFTLGNYGIELLCSSTVIGTFDVTDDGTYMHYDFNYIP